ncbi:MAG: hypothetical protein J6R20_01380 [Clostridia bacterium]|nr:hypothetical protein [Clostridia bacterium]
MTKAKRLLAVLMAMLMIISAAFLPAYAKMLPGNQYVVPKKTYNQKYYFDPEQGAGWLLDQLDQLLAEANIKIDLEDEIGGTAMGLINGLVSGDGYKLSDINNTLDLTSIDKAVESLYVTLTIVTNSGLLNFLGGLFGDLLNDEYGLKVDGLNLSIKRGQRSQNFSGGSNDLDVLYMILNWLNSLRPMIKKLVMGQFSLGSIIEGILPGEIKPILSDLPGYLKLMLYQMLIDSEATALPTDTATPIDDGLQKVINWALITGTSAEAGGMTSLLGENAEPLMPYLANLEEQGAANLKGVAIKVDHNGDGVLEDKTMSFYQLVANVLDALLNGMLAPMLGELIADLVGVEITEQYPEGDPAIFSDMMFNTILGAVESLAEQNGAPNLEYTEEQNATPMGKINALMDWFFNKGGLDTFIKIDFWGIQLTDNFMSLLGDLGRLAINLLPGLHGDDLFGYTSKIAYTAEELNLIYFYKTNANGQYVICEDTEEGAIDQTYVTYEKGEVIYATAWDPDTEAPIAYNYMSNHQPVDIDADNAGSDSYRNASLIRPNYIITKDQVFACLIKMVFNGFIDGCYWPEWTTDMPSVLAYAMAALAAPALPHGNFFARLDAYHQTGGVAPISDANGNSVEPIPYYTIKNGIEVPTGALDIGAALAAYYLNAVFDFQEHEMLTDVGTTFEQFVAEFLIWAADKYLPILVGNFNDSTGTFTGSGIWNKAFNSLISSIYSDYASRTLKATPNWDAVYTFLDVTLLKLIPAGWLPAHINTAFDLFDGWLLNNLLKFDLQGILGIFSTNTDESTDLHQPALTVIIRIIDRVLGLVFNGNPVLLPISGRSGVNADGVANVFINHTSITSLDTLLDASSESSALPTFVDQLLALLISNKESLMTTLLPLIMGGAYEKPYDKEFGSAANLVDDDWLTAEGYGRDLSTYTVDELQWYIDMFRADVNAIKGATKYATREEAEAAITDESKQYIKAVSFDPQQFDENGEEIYDGFYIYTKNDYYLSATETFVTDTKNGEDNSYSNFSNFTYSHLVPRTYERPYVLYEDYVDDATRYVYDYRAYEVEDFGVHGYVYNNLKKALNDAEDVIATNDSIQDELSDGYGQWQRYFIQTRIFQHDIVDTNGDGVSVTNKNDSDYREHEENWLGQTTQEEVPVDSAPSAPGTAMLPFDIGTNSYYNGATYTYLDLNIDDYVTLNPANYSFSSGAYAKYPQLVEAYKKGLDPEYNIVIPDVEAEEIVRATLGTLSFDITTRDENGNYPAGTFQWNSLTSTQLQDITNFCNSIDYVFTYDVEAGTYEISRPYFKFIDESYIVFATSNKVQDVDACPPVALSGSTDYNKKIDDSMYYAFISFMSGLEDNRKAVYNAIELITDRAEECAEYRSNNKIDTTMIKWAMNLAEIKNAYENGESGIRNRKIIGVNADGTYMYSKVYTQSSYDEFRKAYDFARCLDLAQQGLIQSKGLTQSIVTEAFQNLLKTFNNLVLYTGDADFTQLLEYISIAEGMINNPNKNDAELGYTPDSLANLESVYADVFQVSIDKTIDCEGQQIVDAAAAELLTAINNIVYNSVPKIVATVAGGALTEITSAPGAARTQGHVFGLKEGEGITLELFDIIGMRIDEGVGNNVTVEDSGKGTGTGAYLRGTVGNLEKFRFYAVLYGDINGDTRIDGTDRTAIDLYIVQGVNNNAEPDQGGMGAIKYEAGDVDHSGSVDAADSALIELHYNYADAEGNDYEIPQNQHSPVAIVA